MAERYILRVYGPFYNKQTIISMLFVTLIDTKNARFSDSLNSHRYHPGPCVIFNWHGARAVGGVSARTSDDSISFVHNSTKLLQSNLCIVF